jgi:hypothetical protein
LHGHESDVNIRAVQQRKWGSYGNEESKEIHG